jgi:hypothetical protein
VEEENPERAALLPLHFVLGRWEGEGTSFGSKVAGSLKADLLFGDSFIELRETLWTESGEKDHEDSAWIGYDLLQRKLVATHFSAGASIGKMLVLTGGNGFHWWGGATSPVVRYIHLEERLRVEVVPPGEDAPLHWVDYSRVE